MSSDDVEIAVIKELLRGGGWYVRYTEWPAGHQVVLHRRNDTATHVVTAWWGSELEAWKEAVTLASGRAAAALSCDPWPMGLS